MAHLGDLVARFVALVHLNELARSSASAAIYILPFLVVIYLFEIRAGARTARYRTRHFVSDVVYTLFYQGGFYNVLVLAALTNVLEPHLGRLKLNLLAELPWPAALAVLWIAGDFILYWLHRLQHRVPFLWAFHSVHHSQVRLTALTAYRRHPVEKLIADVVVFFGFMHLVLGIPTEQWLPLYVVITGLITLQHTELNWRFGPLEKLIVSPAFHAIHHSTDPRYYNKNFGQLLSLWDFMFRTATEGERPNRYGVDGLDMTESVPHQLAAPFRYLWRGYTVRSDLVDTPAPPT